ncbi:hypothetical protein [Corynebacterium sp.]|uniref:hypothetical protein n=1 Tax=Corynebacterium sp. TaxID=1720 RepID=UPI0026DBD85C|nr:hypothetical protein [Corynebacterium sp.]MDO5076845.1 hypothetical protein [Corynebacterium sp.]
MPQQHSPFGGFEETPASNAGSRPAFGDGAGGTPSPFASGFGPQPQPQFGTEPPGRSAPAWQVDGPAQAVSATSAPMLALAPSMVMAALSLVLSATITLGSFTPTEFMFRVLSVVAWLAAGIFGITLLGLYFNEDNRRRAKGFYSVIGWKVTLYWVTVGALLVGILWSAVEIGQWVGKL